MFGQKSCFWRFFFVVFVFLVVSISGSMGCDKNGNFILFQEPSHPKPQAQNQPQLAETQNRHPVEAQNQPKTEMPSQPQAVVQDQPKVEVPNQPQTVVQNQPKPEVQSQPKVETPRKTRVIAGPEVLPEQRPVKPEEAEIPVPMEAEPVATSKVSATAEFDGCYLKTKQGYIEIPTTVSFTTQIQQAGMMLGALWNAPTINYTLDYHGGSCPLADFEGIYLQGQYKFEYLSFHPLMKKRLQTGENFFENHGPATAAKPFYIPGAQMPIRTKAGNLSMFFKPQGTLKPGYYVAWIGKDFWIIALH